ncbi:hypothetical protein TNCV_1419481 [Trichonephila clavipes]|nr:hypothetical protein TNCV_1419481 [Trichonephila clavipes]
MDVCKYIVHFRHGDTINNRRAASLLVRLVEGDEGWEASDHLQDVLPQNLGVILKSNLSQALATFIRSLREGNNNKG